MPISRVNVFRILGYVVFREYHKSILTSQICEIGRAEWL